MSQIIWKDFILDDKFGPLLFFPEAISETTSIKCSTEARVELPGTQDGARANIQETRTEQRPARMVGLFDLDSSAHVDMEVGRNISTHLRTTVWQKEEA